MKAKEVFASASELSMAKARLAPLWAFDIRSEAGSHEIDTAYASAGPSVRQSIMRIKVYGLVALWPVDQQRDSPELVVDERITVRGLELYASAFLDRIQVERDAEAGSFGSPASRFRLTPIPTNDVVDEG